MESDEMELKMFRLYQSILPYGYMDMKAAINVLEEYNIDYDDFAEWLEERLEQYDMSILGADICGFAYEHILYKARDIIMEVTRTDIWELSEEIYVAANYMCSTFDRTHAASEFLKEAMEEFPELKEDEFIVTFYNDISNY